MGVAMFTNEQVRLVTEETLVSTHKALATMLGFEAGDGRYTLADVIAAVMNQTGERSESRRSSA